MPLEFLAWNSPPLDFSRTPITKKKRKKNEKNNNNNNKNKKTEIQKKLMRDPPCHVIINGKHAIYFLFLKRFIEIPFVKAVQCIGF